MGHCKSWTLDCGLDHGLDYGLRYGLHFGLLYDENESVLSQVSCLGPLMEAWKTIENTLRVVLNVLLPWFSSC